MLQRLGLKSASDRLHGQDNTLVGRFANLFLPSTTQRGSASRKAFDHNTLNSSPGCATLAPPLRSRDRAWRLDPSAASLSRTATMLRMRVAIIGAGIVGVTTAYELACDGHEVTVFERRGAAAEEASFANAGVIAPGYVTPWAAPGMPTKVLRQALGAHKAVRLRAPRSLGQLAWGWRWLRACDPARYAASRQAMLTLAQFSQQQLRSITSALSLERENAPGFMVLLRSEKDLKRAQAQLELLAAAGIAHRVLKPDQARDIEPALSIDAPLHAAIHLPDDEVGNCRQFALQIKSQAQELGVQFEFNAHVAPLDPNSSTTLSIANYSTQSRAMKSFDSVVVCAGSDSGRLLQRLHVRLPLLPVCGYSISASIREPLDAPRSGVMDEHYKVAITRLGQRVRVAGMAEVGGSLSHIDDSAVQTLYKVLHDWFPGAAKHTAGIQTWKGARPMLPDGPPVIGPAGPPGVWLNLGHGSSGWALSCGSARLLADLLTGRDATPVDPKPFAFSRFSR